MAEQTKEERETHLSMSGDDHGAWELFTDDPYWMRRIEKLDIAPVKAVGAGFVYRLNADQVVVRKGKRKVSEATRRSMISRLKTSRTTGESEGQKQNNEQSIGCIDFV